MSFPKYPKYKDSGVEWLGEVPEHWQIFKSHAEARSESISKPRVSAPPRENRYSWSRRMSFPKNPKYKDSGVEWLGEVPEHWDVVALKRITNLKSGESITGESIDETGDYPVLGGNDLRGYTSAFTHNGHFVVIGRQGALCGNINYSTGKFWASEHAVEASPLKQVETVWLGEMLRAMNLNQHSVSAAQPGLSMEFVGNLRTVLPPIADQTKIASFLDGETSKIDALVREQHRLIELLKEKRQAVISHAVTGKIDVRDLFGSETTSL